jgi:hypothetical protein
MKRLLHLQLSQTNKMQLKQMMKILLVKHMKLFERFVHNLLFEQ